MKALLRSFIPTPFLSLYHLALAWAGAFIYRFPARELTVIGVTGTKGKSTTVELIAAILRGAGHPTAVASTIHFVIGQEEERNLFKMTMPGRFFLQKFLRRAVAAGCTHAVIEMTSEGAVQHRHRGIALNALVFTNLSPEHIESHGSMERYAQAKLSLARALERSSKRPRIVVANADDEYGPQFLDAAVEVRAPFSLQDAEPYTADEHSVRFVWRGTLFSVPMPGLFNLKNCLAAIVLGDTLGVPTSSMQKSLGHIEPIAGRQERIECGQPFEVIVDYAHTPDSLKALFEAFGSKRRICIIGSTGGGRDTWNRPEKGKIADTLCDVSIITDEDPYDEDPRTIAESIAKGFVTHTPTIELNRRAAINQALRLATDNDVVLITGKGTDPYIMRARGKKEPWSDARVAREELKNLGYTE